MSADSGSSLTHHAQAILGVVIAFTVVSTICIVLRMLAKKLRGVRFCFEDGLIAAAQLSLYGLAAVSLLGMHTSRSPNLLSQPSYRCVLRSISCGRGGSPARGVATTATGAQGKSPYIASIRVLIRN